MAPDVPQQHHPEGYEPGAPTGVTFRDRRLAAGLTQEALAERTGLTSRAVRKWESGSARPNQASRVMLAAALGCKPSDLVEDADV